MTLVNGALRPGRRSPALPIVEKLNVESLAHVSVSANFVMASVEARARKLAAGYEAWVGSTRSGEGAAHGSPATGQRN